MVEIILSICKSKPILVSFLDRFHFVFYIAELITLLLHTDIHFQCILTLLQQWIPKCSGRNHLLLLCSGWQCRTSEINLCSVNKLLINTLIYWHQPQEQIKSPANYPTILRIRQLICSQIYHLDILWSSLWECFLNCIPITPSQKKTPSNPKASSLCKIQEKAARHQIFILLSRRCRICCQ